MSNAVCKLCHGKIVVIRLTYVPISLDTILSYQTKRRRKPNLLAANNERWIHRITESISYFICKDLCPYSVVENTGFRNMIYTLQPRYTIHANNSEA